MTAINRWLKRRQSTEIAAFSNPTVSRAAPSWAASDDDLCATGTSFERRCKADSKFMPQRRERIRHVTDRS